VAIVPDGRVRLRNCGCGGFFSLDVLLDQMNDELPKIAREQIFKLPEDRFGDFFDGKIGECFKLVAETLLPLDFL